MPERLLLLTGAFEGTHLVPFLARFAEGRVIQHVETRAELDAATGGDLAGTRLLAFCTAVIVPRSLLGRLPGPAYNIHPGSPEFPGRHPECWAAYAGVGRFGATLHEMAPRVDEGAIIDVAWFEAPADPGQTGFSLAAYKASFELLMRWGAQLTTSDRPLPQGDFRWSGRKTTHRDMEEMCRVTPDIEPAEFERRRRAFAETAGSRMTVMLHGREFHYTVPPPNDSKT